MFVLYIVCSLTWCTRTILIIITIHFFSSATYLCFAPALQLLLISGTFIVSGDAPDFSIHSGPCFWPSSFFLLPGGYKIMMIMMMLMTSLIGKCQKGWWVSVLCGLVVRARMSWWLKSWLPRSLRCRRRASSRRWLRSNRVRGYDRSNMMTSSTNWSLASAVNTMLYSSLSLCYVQGNYSQTEWNFLNPVQWFQPGSDLGEAHWTFPPSPSLFSLLLEVWPL